MTERERRDLPACSVTAASVKAVDWERLRVAVPFGGTAALFKVTVMSKTESSGSMTSQASVTDPNVGTVLGVAVNFSKTTFASDSRSFFASSISLPLSPSPGSPFCRHLFSLSDLKRTLANP